MKRTTWLPFTDDYRFHPPHWVIRIDNLIARGMCAIGIHTETEAPNCWYCGKGHKP